MSEDFYDFAGTPISEALSRAITVVSKDVLPHGKTVRDIVEGEGYEADHVADGSPSEGLVGRRMREIMFSSRSPLLRRSSSPPSRKRDGFRYAVGDMGGMCLRATALHEMAGFRTVRYLKPSHAATFEEGNHHANLLRMNVWAPEGILFGDWKVSIGGVEKIETQMRWPDLCDLYGQDAIVDATRKKLVEYVERRVEHPETGLVGFVDAELIIDDPKSGERWRGIAELKSANDKNWKACKKSGVPLPDAFIQTQCYLQMLHLAGYKHADDGWIVMLNKSGYTPGAYFQAWRIVRDPKVFEEVRLALMELEKYLDGGALPSRLYECQKGPPASEWQAKRGWEMPPRQCDCPWGDICYREEPEIRGMGREGMKRMLAPNFESEDIP